VKITKRLISLLIIASMLISGFGFVLADENDICGVSELGLINALGITEYEEEDLANTITRGEFYTILCRMQGLPETKGTDTVFSDVDPLAEYAGYIRTLAKLGFISSRDGKIYPDAPIKATEAVKLIVNALGYGPKAEAQGYESVAVKLDLYEGIDHSLSGDLKAGDLLVLIYNALHADLMVEAVKVGSSKKEYRVEEGTNLLSASFGVYVAEGVVEGVDITRVKGENDVRPYHIEIDGLSLNVGLTGNPYEYLGYEVKAYWRDIRNFEPTLIYMAKTSGNEEVVIDIDDIVSINDGKLEAYVEEGNKNKTYKLKNAIPVVYNGAATGMPLTEDMIKDKSGSLKLLDNNGNGAYDIVFADIYENYVVSYVDTENMIIYDKFDTSKSICLDNTLDDPYITVYDASEKEISIAFAAKNNVVSVFSSAKDAYQTYIKAYVSNAVVSGEVESTELSENIITVDGTQYELSDSVISRFGSLIVPGASVSMTLDIGGKVASIEAATVSGYNYGYLLGADTEGTLDSKIKFKLYTTDGEFIEAYGASNVYIDGNKYKNYDESIKTVLHDVSKTFFGEETPEASNATVVKYSLNSSGEISVIDTPINGSTGVLAVRADELKSKDSLFGIKAEGTASTDIKYRRSGNHNTIGPKVAFSVDALCISAPSALNDEYLKEENYEAAKALDLLQHNTSYPNLWAFYDNHNKAASDFVAVFDIDGMAEPQETVKFSLVEQYSLVYDEADGGEKYALTLLTADGTIKLTAKDSCKVIAVPNDKDSSVTAAMTVSDLKKGDIVLYSTNPKGELTSVTLWYRTETDTSTQTLSTSRWAARSVRVGYVYESFEDGYLVYFTDDVANMEKVTAEDCEFVINTGSDPTYFVYTKEDDGRNRISVSDMAAIKTYKDTGDDANKIFLHTRYGQPYTVVIFE